MKVTKGRTYLTRSGAIREVVDILQVKDHAPVVYWRVKFASERYVGGYMDLDRFEDICLAEEET
jgi:hypothetical protein